MLSPFPAHKSEYSSFKIGSFCWKVTNRLKSYTKFCSLEDGLVTKLQQTPRNDFKHPRVVVAKDNIKKARDGWAEASCLGKTRV